MNALGGAVGAWAVRRARLLLLCGPLLVYCNSFDTPFHYDDFHSIVENPHIRSLDKVGQFFGREGGRFFSADSDIRMYRPLLLTTYALNYAVSGYAVWSYHLVALALHLFCVQWVYALGRLFGLGGGGALFAAMLFGVHPVNSETLNYISSRSELLAAAAVFAGLYVYLKAAPGWGRRLGVWGGLGLGLLSKAVAVVLPPLALVYGLALKPRRLGDKVLWGGCVAGIAAYLAWNQSSVDKAVRLAPVRPWDEQIWTQAKAVVFYLKLLVWPSGLNVDHQFQLSQSPFDLYAGSACLFMLSAAVWLLGRRRSDPFLAAGGAAFLVALAPTSLVPLNVLVNEHRLYIPSAVFCWSLAYGGGRLWAASERWRTPLQVGAAVVLVGAGAMTAARNQVWGSPLRLWADAAAKAPQLARPRIFLAEAQERAGASDAALRSWEEAIRLDPGYGPAYAHAARLWRQAGDLARAEGVLRAGIELQEDAAGAWAELALLLRLRAEAGRGAAYARIMGESAAAYERALEAAPDDTALLNNLGNTYQVLGRNAEALRLHEDALRLDGGDARTWVNAGNALMALGRPEDARERFRRATLADPGYGGAWLSLGMANEKTGRNAGAVEAYRRAVEAEPGAGAFVAERLRLLEGGGDGP